MTIKKCSIRPSACRDSRVNEVIDAIWNRLSLTFRENDANGNELLLFRELFLEATANVRRDLSEQEPTEKNLVEAFLRAYREMRTETIAYIGMSEIALVQYPTSRCISLKRRVEE